MAANNKESQIVVVKSNLIEAVTKITEAPKIAVDSIINTFLDLVVAQIAQDRKVELRGFGQFEPVERAARKGRHPVTGDTIDIPPCKGLKFKPGSNMMKALGHDDEE